MKRHRRLVRILRSQEAHAKTPLNVLDDIARGLL